MLGEKLAFLNEALEDPESREFLARKIAKKKARKNHETPDEPLPLQPPGQPNQKS